MATVRRVRRVVRKIDPWTVLKVSLVFNAVAAIGFVLGLVIFWSVLSSAGIPQKVDEIAQQITLIDPGETLVSNVDKYFRLVVFMAVVWAVLATGLATLATVMYNLISDVVGGVEVVVLEETLQPSSGVVRPPTRPAVVTRPVADEADVPTKETAAARVGANPGS